jgi:hypothetical protein
LTGFLVPIFLKESIFGYFSENLGLFRYVLVCFGCFDIGSKHRNKRNFLCFWFHETNQNKRETDLVSVRTENYFCWFRGQPSLPILLQENMWTDPGNI